MSGTPVSPVVPNAKPLAPLLQPTRYGSKTAAAPAGNGAVTGRDATNVAKRLRS